MTSPTEPAGHELITKIAGCCAGMAFQAGEPAVDLAGHTLSFLVAHPEHIPRYMREGNALWIDGTITFDGGCLTYRANDGDIHHPRDIRKGKSQ